MPIINQVDRELAILLYLSPTIACFSILTQNQKNYIDYVNFYCDLALELKLESIALPVCHDIAELISLVSKRNLQIIPILDLQESTQIFSERFLHCVSAESNIVPIVGFKFSTFRNANKGYKLVMDKLDQLHEKYKATMMVDAPRYIRSIEYSNVSSLHYSPFYIADIVAEKFRGSSGRTSVTKKPNFRLFSRQELSVPIIEQDNKSGLDIDKEKALFENDRKLQDLLVRSFHGDIVDKDLTGYRYAYISRIHENIRTRQEFTEFQKNIESNTTRDYLDEKKSMKKVISAELADSNRTQ